MNPANVFNIESSLNQWLRTQLATYTPPAFFSGFPGDRLIVTMPEEPANVPAFSVTHLLVDTDDRYQGRNVSPGEVGVWYEAFMDVSSWVTRDNANWVAEQRWMGAILQDIVLSAKSITMTDYLTNYPSSSSVSYAIYIDRLDARQTTPDPNPDFERQRFLIKYHTILRS